RRTVVVTSPVLEAYRFEAENGPSAMLLIPCPWCGPRDEVEFHYGGEAHIARPADPDALDDAVWADYLYLRANPKGVLAQRWVHRHGSRRRFNLLRDTVSPRILP